MKRLQTIGLLALLVLASMYSGLFAYIKQSSAEFESLHLAYTIDLCSDAAAFKMMDTNDIQADYQDMSSVQVNPQVALDTFLDCFAFNYGMRPNAENRALIMNKYVPNLTVAGYDGFWMAQPACSYDGDRVEYSAVFTPKLPYRASKTVGGTTSYYALNMGSRFAIKLNKDNKTFTRIDVSKLKVANPTKENPDLSSYETRQAIVNKDLTNAIGASIDANVDKTGWRNTFFLPGNLTTYTNVNPVSGPSILALVENVDLLTGRKASAFSITGAKVTTSRPVIAYSKKDMHTGDSNKFYCYADKLLNKKGSPLYPFLQFDKNTQRYIWWEFPQYKYMACSDKVDFDALREDPDYVLPSIDTASSSAIDYAAILANDDHTEVYLEGIFGSKKEAAEEGYMYDSIPMRTVAK